METIKLLPQSKKINTASFLGKEKNESGGSPLSVISQKVIRIEKLLGGQNKLLQSRTKNIKKQEEISKRKRSEDKLEEKPKDKEEKDGRKLLKGPRLGFLDRIKNFLGKMILGFIAVRLIPYLPQLLQIVPKIAAVNEFFIDTGIGLIDGLATFVQKGYEAYDFTKKSLKNFGGDNLVKLFDRFNGAMGTLIEASIIAALAFGDLGGGDGGGSGGSGGRRGGGYRNGVRRGQYNGFNTRTTRSGNLLSRTGDALRAQRGDFSASGSIKSEKDIMKRYFQKYGRDAFVHRFGQEGLEALPGGITRSGATKFVRNAFVGLAGKGGVKSILKFTKPLLKRIPIIGALLDFGLSVALGEDPGRAAFKAIGAGLVGALGTAIGSLAFGAGGIIGGIIGSIGGDLIGGVLYDMFFGNKKPTQKGKTKAKAGGGITRGGRTQGPISRSIKKKKISRVVKPTKTKLDPGKNVGGKENVEKLFPENKKGDQANPLGYIEDTYDTTDKIPFFGPIFNVAYKTLLGDKPNTVDYKNISYGLNSWMNNTFDSDVMRSGGAFAGGGEVNAQMFMKGEDLTNVIAKSVEDSISTRIDDTINELQKQLQLKQATGPDKSDPTLDIEDDFSPSGTTEGQWGPLLDLIAGKESGGNYEAMYPSTTLPGATKMTIAEVARRATGAVGKYQQLPQYLISRAKAAGLNPERDLFSPRNQDLIITKVNIEGNRGGRRWLNGEISDEQFMQGLSQEFASLPNANGRFYYPGQRSSITPARVKSALSKVKRGGYSQNLDVVGGGIGSGYGSGGVKIAGDLGDYLKSNRNNIGITGSIHQHPRHPGQSRRNYFSYHNQGRALDIGGYGPNHPSSGGRDEQAPIIRALLQWNKKNGYKPVEIIHGSPAFKGLGKYESSPNALHSNHVHVAYARGGLVRGFTKAILGERGVEFVLDNDTTVALQKTFPGFLDALNRANLNDAVNVLRDYASYEVGATQEVQITNNIINMMVDSPQPTTFVIGDSNDGIDDFAEALVSGQ